MCRDGGAVRAAARRRGGAARRAGSSRVVRRHASRPPGGPDRGRCPALGAVLLCSAPARPRRRRVGDRRRGPGPDPPGAGPRDARGGRGLMSDHAEEELDDFRPRRSRARILLFVILGLIVMFFLGTLFASLYTDRLWYSSV